MHAILTQYNIVNLLVAN